MTDSKADLFGVIAGAGKFPNMVIEGAKKAGHRVVVLGLKEIADPALADIADEFHWVRPLRLGEWIRTFNRAGVKHAVMAGYVRKQSMFRRFGILSFLPDKLFLKLWFKDIPDKRNDTVLKAVADLLAKHDIILEDVTKHCPSAVAPKGVLGSSELTAVMKRDLEFGWKIAKAMGDLDIGQSIAVKNTEVIAIEAIEGTDQMIERSGALCKHGGWMMIKVAKPDQDMRFDVPTIGPDTIENLQQHGAKSLVIEAGKTVVVDADKTIEAANRYGLSVVAVPDTN